jgi:hypothetical protein
MRISSYLIEPRVVRQPRGSYLALTPDDCPLRIGVIGNDEAEARALFDESLKRWREISEIEVSEDQDKGS